MVTIQEYGIAKDGTSIQQFIFQNKNGVEVRCINLGCRLTNFFLPAPNGEVADILLGYDTLAAYEKDTSAHGAFVGRYANRIQNACFTIHETEYPLTKNSGNNFLHGSFQYRIFDAEIIGESSLSLTYISPDGEDGFPGELWVGVSYSLTDENKFVMDYRAVSTADTYVNFTNHSYFNLAGEGNGNILEQQVWLNSKYFLEIDDTICPTGRIVDCLGGAMDFFVEKPIGKDINSSDPQLVIAKGYDHAYILEKDVPHSLVCGAIAKDSASQRAIRVYTTQPSIQFFTANGEREYVGKNGHVYGKHSGFCLETQHYPCSPNHPDFSNTLLEKGQKFHHITILEGIL